MRGHTFYDAYHAAPGFPFKFIIPGEGYGTQSGLSCVGTCSGGFIPAIADGMRNINATHTHWWLSYL